MLQKSTISRDTYIHTYIQLNVRKLSRSAAFICWRDDQISIISIFAHTFSRNDSLQIARVNDKTSRSNSRSLKRNLSYSRHALCHTLCYVNGPWNMRSASYTPRPGCSGRLSCWEGLHDVPYRTPYWNQVRSQWHSCELSRAGWLCVDYISAPPLLSLWDGKQTDLQSSE